MSATTEPAITLYEIAGNAGAPWNPTGLKTRFALNYKGIPYKAIQLEYCDIEPTLRTIGAEPTATKPNGQPYYTVPVIVDTSRHTPDGGPTVIADSWKIAEYLEETYPDVGPSLFPHGTKGLQKLFEEQFLETVFKVVAPMTFAAVLSVLNEPSQKYWRVTREAYLGSKLEDCCPKGSPKWIQVYEGFQKGLTGIATLLDKTDGPFVMGNTVSYADFAIASLMESAVYIIPDQWEEIKHWDGGRWADFRDDCAAWKSARF